MAQVLAVFPKLSISEKNLKHTIHLKKLPSKEYTKVLILRTLGNFLIYSSLFMIAKTFYQPVTEEVRYFINQQLNRSYKVVDISETKTRLFQPDIGTPEGGLAKLLNVKPVKVLVPEDPNFSIVIPKIGANARILGNVDASDESVYLQALREGVAHTLGTAFPGEGGHIFLFAHSTDYVWNVGTYNAVFYLLYKLDKGDEVNIFYKGQRYLYKVTGKKVVDPSEVEYLTRKTNREFLTMQTCWPPGTTLQRLLVFAQRVSE